MTTWFDDLRGEITAATRIHVEAALAAGEDPDGIEARVLGVLIERLSGAITRTDPHMVAREIGLRFDKDHPGWHNPRRLSI